MSNNTENNDTESNDVVLDDDCGPTGWDETAANYNRPKTPRAKWDDMLKIKNGTLVRLITKPHRYWIHKYKPFPEYKGIPQKIKCSKTKEDPRCVLCDMVEVVDGKKRPACPRSERFYIGVIDRKTQSQKVIDAPPGLHKKFHDLFIDEDWGDLTQYDVLININPSTPNEYYSVIQKPKKPLTEADLALKRDMDMNNLRLKCKPDDYEWVLKRVADIKANCGAPLVHNESSENEDVSSEEDGTDFGFPAA